MSENQNGWNEWSRHILKELERLNENYEGLRIMNEEIKVELSRASSVKEEVLELKTWKKELDEVSSPTQLKELVEEVRSLKTFKTMAVTIWAVVQFLTAMAFGLSKFF
jgi:hypothetical protein|tara:strand:- start:504 stop:827 length:324 start_codon:yes stop_codon:yes gene_type:complete